MKNNDEAIAADNYKYIGTRSIRPDGFEKVTGRANYGADLSLPGMIWGKMLRSPHAHAMIKNIDTSRAEALAGVMAVVTYDDFPGVSSEIVAAGEGTEDLLDLARNLMADGKVLYHGHAILGVAAISKQIAEQALELIDIDYDILPAVLDVRDAMAKDAPILHQTMFTKGLSETPTTPSNVASVVELKKGDIQAGFAQADIVIEREFYTPTVHQGYIEPHACTVRYDEHGQSMVWCSTQGHFDVRSTTAKLLHMSLSKLKVIASEIKYISEQKRLEFFCFSWAIFNIF